MLLFPLGQAALTPRPNVVIVLSDDQGWSDVGYSGQWAHQPGAGGAWQPNPPQTPNLDAMARSESTLTFRRFYAGSAVCSPTRSAVLTGRSPDRECIWSAEGCGQEPAWSCADKLPLPPTTFTVAEAAREAGYATIHVGKWHLGNFFPMNDTTRRVVRDNAWVDVDVSTAAEAYAYRKWPSSSPGAHGFDEWHSTEASASSTTPNCACDPTWLAGGCISGGGAWGPTPPGDCTNYWAPSDLDAEHRPTRAACRTTNSTRDCVANLTSKIGATRVPPDTGDDTEHIMNTFEAFLRRKASGGKEAAPFLAALWLHTNHDPHPALPQYYYAYNDSHGAPAGDYLGTLTQMDAQIGRLRSMLRSYGVANDTLLWYLADNGPHVLPSQRMPLERDVRASTNGLRQCKASLFEGGIRVPGMIEWPAVVRANREIVSLPANAYDILPTVLDILGVSHPRPDWASDGMSLLPLLRGEAEQPRPSERPLCFELGKQAACIDNEWKILHAPAVGQCAWNDDGEPPLYMRGAGSRSKTGPFLFNLKDDPTESTPLNDEHPALLKKYTDLLTAWRYGVSRSQWNESTCMPPPKHDLRSP